MRPFFLCLATLLLAAGPGEGVFIGDPLARPFAPTLREDMAGNVSESFTDSVTLF